MNSSHQKPPPGKSLRSKILNYFSVRINGESNHSPSRPQKTSRQQFQQPATHHRRSDHSHARAGHNATKEQPRSSHLEAGSPWDMPQASPLPNKPAPAKLRFWDGVVADISAAINGPPPAPRSSAARSGAQPSAGRSSSTHHQRHHSERSNSARSPSRRHHQEHSHPDPSQRSPASPHRRHHHERSDSGYRSVSSQDRRRHDEHHNKHGPPAEHRPTSYCPPSVDTILETPAPVSFKHATESVFKAPHSPSANAKLAHPASRSKKKPADADQGVGRAPREPTHFLRMPFTTETKSLYTVPKHSVHVTEEAAAARNSIRASIETQKTYWGDFIPPPSDPPIPKLPASSTAEPAALPAPRRTPSSSKKPPSSSPSTHRHHHHRHHQQTQHPTDSAPITRNAVPGPSPPITRDRDPLKPSPLVVTRKPVPAPSPSRTPHADDPRDPSRCELCKGPSDARTSWADLDRHLCLACARKAFYPEPAAPRAPPPTASSPPNKPRPARAPAPAEPESDSDSDSDSDREPWRRRPSSPTSTVFAPLFPQLSRAPAAPRPDAPSLYIPASYAPPSPSSLDPDYALPSPTSPVAAHHALRGAGAGAGSYADRYASSMDLNPFASADPWLRRPAVSSRDGSSASFAPAVRGEAVRGGSEEDGGEKVEKVEGEKVKGGRGTRDLINGRKPLAPLRSPSPLIPVSRPSLMPTEGKSPAPWKRRSSFYGFYDEVLRPGSEWVG